MSITVFTKPKSILSIVVALVFIFDANLIMQLFGMSLDDAGIMMTRILGGAYLGLGISFWFINGPDDIDKKSAYLYPLYLYHTRTMNYVLRTTHPKYKHDILASVMSLCHVSCVGI